jgi:hypothetical protein
MVCNIHARTKCHSCVHARVRGVNISCDTYFDRYSQTVRVAVSIGVPITYTHINTKTMYFLLIRMFVNIYIHTYAYI